MSKITRRSSSAINQNTLCALYEIFDHYDGDLLHVFNLPPFALSSMLPMLKRRALFLVLLNVFNGSLGLVRYLLTDKH